MVTPSADGNGQDRVSRPLRVARCSSRKLAESWTYSYVRPIYILLGEAVGARRPMTVQSVWIV